MVEEVDPQEVKAAKEAEDQELQVAHENHGFSNAGRDQMGEVWTNQGSANLVVVVVEEEEGYEEKLAYCLAMADEMHLYKAFDLVMEVVEEF